MLKHLHIRNYALISELEFTPANDLTVITGETGAGKSIMLGALGLLLGNRADSKALFNEEEKCIIEGTFSLDPKDYSELYEEADVDPEAECIIRREIASSGKSRAFINDTPVNLDVLKKWATRLVDIHSQHDTLMLANQLFQLDVLDAFSNALVQRQQYNTYYKTFRKSEEHYQQLKSRANEDKKQLDYFSFLFKELDEAALKAGEQEVLEEKQKMLENSEQIKGKLTQASEFLAGEQNSVIDQLRLAEKNLESLSKFSDQYKTLQERLRSSLAEVKDIAAELEDQESSVEYNPGLIQELEDRLSRIYSLQTKHQVKTVEELIAIRDEMGEKVSRTENLDQELQQLEAVLDKQYKELIKLGKELSAVRQKHAEPLKKQLETLLKEVGMPNAAINIEVKTREPSAHGIDEVAILFSANKGVPPQELKNAASGGEFSRLMLCIKYVMAERVHLPTVVFDEIDTGISGEVAIKVGKLISKMAVRHQVITITHLPQMACQGDTHCYVYKDNQGARTASRIRQLSEKERVEEIAKMIGGEKPSATALENARELLAM